MPCLDILPPLTIAFYTFYFQTPEQRKYQLGTFASIPCLLRSQELLDLNVSLIISNDHLTPRGYAMAFQLACLTNKLMRSHWRLG